MRPILLSGPQGCGKSSRYAAQFRAQGRVVFSTNAPIVYHPEGRFDVVHCTKRGATPIAKRANCASAEREL